MANFRERLNELYEEARDENPAIGRQGFANLLGMTRGQVNGWLDGASRPNFEKLMQIAARTGVTSSWLLGESEFRNLIEPEMKGITPEVRHDYLLLLDFLKFKYRSEIVKKRREKETVLGSKDEHHDELS